MEKGVLVNKTPIIFGSWNVWTGILIQTKHWQNIAQLQLELTNAFNDVEEQSTITLAEAFAERLQTTFLPKGGLILVSDHETVYAVVWGEALKDPDVKAEILNYIFNTGEIW